MNNTSTRFLLLIVFTAFFSGSIAAQLPARSNVSDRYVLMVSFDGFRHDYVDRWQLQNFQKLIAQGAQAEGLIPAYPSKTFPNHYTLVTGLYPGTHGLVDNSFYDPQQQRNYSINNREAVENAAFYGGVPLWQFVQNHGLHAASYFWVGSEAPIAGSFPDYYEIYDTSVSNEARIATVLEWLALPETQRPHFITLYFSLVDSASHANGPLAEATRKSAQTADRLLGQLTDAIELLPLPIDTIVVSDHGMTGVKPLPDSVIALNELGLPQEGLILVNDQTQVLLYIENSERREAVYLQLKSQQNHFKVFHRQDTPQSWHYRDSNNIGDLVLAAEPGYVFADAMDKIRWDNMTEVGVHGYDPALSTDLQGIFYAAGPHIKKGSTVGPIDNIHVFPFILQLLNLPEPDWIEGSQAVLYPLMTH